MRRDIYEGRTWAVEVGHAGVDVRVLSGAVWLTIEGDPEDHVLEAPARFTTGRHGKAVLFALTPARVDVSAPLARPLGREAQAAVG